MGKIFTCIMEEHNEAFYVWNYALRKGLINKDKNILMHVDHHSDMGFGRYKFNADEVHDLELNQLSKLVQDKISIGNFIVPAIYQEIFDNVVLIMSLEDKIIKEDRIAVTLTKDNVLQLKTRDYALKRLFLRPEFNEKYLFFNIAAGGKCDYKIESNPVLDIDIDYFCWDDTLSTSGMRISEVSKESYEKYKENKYHYLKLNTNLEIKKENGRYYLSKRDCCPEEDFPEDRVIQERIENFISYLVEYNITPQIIDICRSRFSGYTPQCKYKYIEENLIKGLKEIYDLDIVNISSIA